MRKVHRTAGALLVFASIVALAGCNGSPTAVDPDYSAVLPVQETICPTIGQICNAICFEIESTCPAPYRSWGDENSCQRTLLAQLLDSYKSCLTGNELSDVRDCVYEKLGTVNVPDGKGPIPHQS